MKRLVALILSVVFLGVFIDAVKTQAQESYPVKPISFVVGIGAGSDGDVMMRKLCAKVTSLIGKPLVVVNKPGAGGSLGYKAIHDAKPDGYTIGLGMGTLITNKLQGTLPYDHHDVTMMAVIYDMKPAILGSRRSKHSFKTIKEVLEFAKSNPGEATIATGGVGYMLWYQTMTFIQQTGLKFNIIPQPGATAYVVTQLAGGHVDLAVAGIPGAKPQVDAGNVRILAVMGAERPAAPYNDVPSLKEFGLESPIASTGTVIGPPNMPKEITQKLAKVFKTAITDPEYTNFLRSIYIVPNYMPPEKAVPYLDAQRDAFRQIGEKAGVVKAK